MNKMITTESKLPRAPATLIDDRRIRRFGYLITFFLLFGVFGWAGSAKIDGAAVAPGVVVVQSYRQAVQHLEGGIIRQLMVREGDLVQVGQPVALLDDTQFASQLEAVSSELGAAQAIEARLQAEREEHQNLSFPPELLERAAEDPRLVELMESERAVFAERRQNLQAQFNVLNQRIVSLQSEIDGLEERGGLLSRRSELYQEELEGLRKLFAEKMGDKVRLRQLEREYIEVQSDLSAARTQQLRAQVAIEETYGEIEKIKQDFRTDVATELSSVRQRIFAARERLRGLTDQVRRSTIQSPATGRVVDLKVHTVGAVLPPGARLMDVVPETEELVIDAEVAPDDIDKVYPGLNADVRFTSLSFRTTPVVHGTVETVSADRLENQQGQPYFLARIKVPEDQFALLGDQDVVPGMSVMVYIVTGERTALEYVMQPLSDALANSMRED